MSNRSTLISFFETGDFPLASEFADWLDSTPLWEKTTLLFSSFQPNATDTNTITLFSGAAGTTPIAVKFKHTIPFSGGTVASADIEIKDSNGSVLLAFSDVFGAVGDTVGFVVANITLNFLPDQANPSNYTAQLFITGDIIDNLVAGSVDIWVLENPVV